MAGELKRFKRVLHVRDVEREITESELAVKMREEESILTRLNEIEARREDAIADFCSGKGVVSPRQLWFERQSLDVMERKMNKNKQELECCRAEIEETKTILLERYRNVQMMEHFVGRLKEREVKKGIDAEQNNLDDITTMRYRRISKGEGGA